MKRKVSKELRPPPHIYGDLYERSLDPWHKDAFPPELSHAAPSQGQRAEGWMAIDHFGNPIGFFPDGMEVEVKPNPHKGRCKAMSGKYETEYRWALANPTNPAAKSLLDLAAIYASSPDVPTLGLIEGAVTDVRKQMVVDNMKPRPIFQ